MIDSWTLSCTIARIKTRPTDSYKPPVRGRTTLIWVKKTTPSLRLRETTKSSASLQGEHPQRAENRRSSYEIGLAEASSSRHGRYRTADHYRVKVVLYH